MSVVYVLRGGSERLPLHEKCYCEVPPSKSEWKVISLNAFSNISEHYIDSVNRMTSSY